MEKLKIEDSFLGTSFDSNLNGEFKFDLLIDESIPKNGNFVVNSDMLKINIKRDIKATMNIVIFSINLKLRIKTLEAI